MTNRIGVCGAAGAPQFWSSSAFANRCATQPRHPCPGTAPRTFNESDCTAAGDEHRILLRLGHWTCYLHCIARKQSHIREVRHLTTAISPANAEAAIFFRILSQLQIIEQPGARRGSSVNGDYQVEDNRVARLDPPAPRGRTIDSLLWFFWIEDPGLIDVVAPGQNGGPKVFRTACLASISSTDQAPR